MNPSTRFFSSLTVKFMSRGTPLHDVVRTCKQAVEVRDFLKKYPREVAATMVRAVDDEGKIPLELINRNNLLYRDQCEIASFLCELITTSHAVRPLAEKLSVDEVTQQYYPAVTEAFRENLTLACSAANAARSIVKYSSSHPDMNSLPAARQNKITSIVNFFKDATTHYNPEQMTKACRRLMVGNCYEMSMIAVDYMTDMARNPLWAHIVEIKNGDHTFVVIGDQPMQDANQYWIKNTNVTFCNPWGGSVGRFYIDSLLKKMGDLKLHRTLDGKWLNVDTTFNPNYHLFSILKTFEITGKPVGKMKDESHQAPDFYAEQVRKYLAK